MPKLQQSSSRPTSTHRRRRHHHWPRCPYSGKVRFREHADATEALRNARRTILAAARDDVPTTHRETRSYKCRCGGWHLTSQPQWRSASPIPQRSDEPGRRCEVIAAIHLVAACCDRQRQAHELLSDMA